jgi:hypothetical protein
MRIEGNHYEIVGRLQDSLPGAVVQESARERLPAAKAPPLQWSRTEKVIPIHGDTLVLSASLKYELPARNKLGERVLSSLAVVGDEIFIRTYEHLWCLGGK